MRIAIPPAVLLTALLVAISAPHAAEDFQFGKFEQMGVPSIIPATALGVMYATQAIGAFLAGRNARFGYVLLSLGGILWCVGALIVHGREIVGPGDYRYGWFSKALEVGIIFLGAATAFAAEREARSIKCESAE